MGPGAPSVGLGLGQPWALILEFAVTIVGFGLFLWRVKLSAMRRAAIGGVVLAAAALTWLGTVAPRRATS